MSMKTARAALAVLLACVLVNAKGNDFNVRYNGGSVQTNVSPHDWDNKLTVTSEAITLSVHDKEHTHFQIPSKSVTSLSYGQEAHRRVGTMIALAILVAPVALFGLFHKTRLHFIAIQYKLPDGKTGGILLQGDKSNYRAILQPAEPNHAREREESAIEVGLGNQRLGSEPDHADRAQRGVAEAKARYDAGCVWWLDSAELIHMAPDEQTDGYEGDPWEEVIGRWTDDRSNVSIAEVLERCLQKPQGLWTQSDKNRAAHCLRFLGWERYRERHGARLEWRYRRKEK
jgi:hypothetical protein